MLRYGLVPDSGGAGRCRGGLASEMEFKVFAPNTVVTARNRDRSRFSAWGSSAAGRAPPRASGAIKGPTMPSTWATPMWWPSIPAT